MIKYALLTVTVLLTSTLAVAPAEDADAAGSYISEDSLRVLVLDEDGSYILRSTVRSERKKEGSKILTPGNWTLSYGSWRQEGSFVVLIASDEIVGDFLDMQIAEKATESDSVSFKFESPCISDASCKRQYSCVISIGRSSVEDPQFDCESFVISRDSLPYPSTLIITIVPQALTIRPYSIQYNYLWSSAWRNLGFENNDFVVRIDKFTPEYIYYIRFLNEYMPVDESGIYVRGVRYTKRSE